MKTNIEKIPETIDRSSKDLELKAKLLKCNYIQYNNTICNECKYQVNCQEIKKEVYSNISNYL